MSNLKYNGVSYLVRLVGGYGWSRGCGSIIEALDGPDKGQFFRADIGKGISNLRGKVTAQILEEERCIESNYVVSEGIISKN